MGSKPKQISASRGAAILGLSKYKTQLEAWIEIMSEERPEVLEKLGIKAPEFSDNAAFRWGLALEDPAIRVIESISGWNIVLREAFFSAPGAEFVTCHIDGKYKREDGLYRLHEGKTVNPFTFRKEWGEPGTDHIPVDYQAQVQHQMLCTGSDEVLLSVLVLPKMQDEMGDPESYNLDALVDVMVALGDLHLYVIKRNEETIRAMKQAYISFWNNHVLTGKQPEPQTFDDVRKLFHPPVGTAIASEEIERMSLELKQIKEEISSAQSRVEQLKGVILNFMRMNADADIDTTERCLLLDKSGKQLNSWNGKKFR